MFFAPHKMLEKGYFNSVANLNNIFAKWETSFGRLKINFQSD